MNAHGIATLLGGDEIRCSKSWDDCWWFFFCNVCKDARPPIIGVLRGARIELSMEQIRYTTDSENLSRSRPTSESDSAFDSSRESIEDDLLQAQICMIKSFSTGFKAHEYTHARFARIARTLLWLRRSLSCDVVLTLKCKSCYAQLRRQRTGMHVYTKTTIQTRHDSPGKNSTTM